MAAPRTGEFRSVGDFPVLPEERHHAVWSQGKLWLFGRQFLDQPTFNFGHYVSYGGGHSTSFDTATGKWDEQGPRPFAAVSSDENLDEVVFAFGAQIFMLLYVHFGGFRIADLHRFDEHSGEWAKSADVSTLPQHEIAVDQEKGFKQSLVLVKTGADYEHGVLFVSFVDHNVRVHLLRRHPPRAAHRWELVAQVPDAVNVPRLQPTLAAYVDGCVFIQGGVQGCGFRWQPLALIKVDVGIGQSTFIEIEPSGGADAHHHQKPAFSFSGSEAQALLPHTWLHFAGRNASGMTGSVFNGEVWALRGLDGDAPKWTLLQQRIPDPKTDGLHIFLDTAGDGEGGDGGELYVCAKYLGVLQAHFKAI